MTPLACDGERAALQGRVRCLITLVIPTEPVVLFFPKRTTREWRNPENLSLHMMLQGVLSTNLNCQFLRVWLRMSGQRLMGRQLPVFTSAYSVSRRKVGSISK